LFAKLIAKSVAGSTNDRIYKPDVSITMLVRDFHTTCLVRDLDRKLMDELLKERLLVLLLLFLLPSSSGTDLGFEEGSSFRDMVLVDDEVCLGRDRSFPCTSIGNAEGMPRTHEVEDNAYH
jgi:hypothetical protein